MAPRAFLPCPDAVGEAITHALGLLWDKERGAPYKMIPAKPPWREKTEIIVEVVSQADLDKAVAAYDHDAALALQAKLTAERRSTTLEARVAALEAQLAKLPSQ